MNALKSRMYQHPFLIVILATRVPLSVELNGTEDCT